MPVSIHSPTVRLGRCSSVLLIMFVRTARSWGSVVLPMIWIWVWLRVFAPRLAGWFVMRMAAMPFFGVSASWIAWGGRVSASSITRRNGGVVFSRLLLANA